MRSIAQLEDWSQDASNQTQMRLADPSGTKGIWFQPIRNNHAI